MRSTRWCCRAASPIPTAYAPSRKRSPSRHFFDAGKPVAAICHGPWTLVEADVVRGKRMTSWPSLKTDLKNAGANWVDEQVVRDGLLVTSRKPDDLPAFCREMLALFAEPAHRRAA